MRTALYVLLALSAPALAGQTVYKWVDEKGVTHFSDQPMAGAEKVELSAGSNRSSEAPAPASTPSAPQPSQDKGPTYSRFVVESPQQDESIVNTGGIVQVRLAASPSLSPAHQVSLYLDGVKVEGLSATSAAFELSTVPRGTHTVKAVLTTTQGKLVQETAPVTFHVRQESAAQPPVGPNMRPNPPKRTSGNKMRTKQPTYAALNGGMPKIDPRTNRPVNAKPDDKPEAPPSTLPADGPKNSVPPKNSGK